MAFLEYARRFYDPIKDMSDKYNILQTALASSERIFRLLDEEISPEYAESRARARARCPAVAVPAGLRVLHRRPRDRVPGRLVLLPGDRGRGNGGGGEGPPVLRGVTFVLEEGQTGAIVGATGAGKTTVLSLLCRFYEIRRGKILLFGRDIREIPREELRGSLALVLQDTFLFSGTVRENVAAGGEAVGAALSAIGVERFTREWGEGLATDVGERGVRLSTGQRQMVSFARALAREPRVLLLDEATSSVDPVTEGRIQEALAGILPGRTALVVAHRLSTVLSADRIIVMHKGKVRETGTHGELMAAGGIYRRLYALQFEEGG